MQKLIVPTLKPRARHLNEVLMGRSGGPMKNPKNPSRQHQKQQLQRTINDHI